MTRNGQYKREIALFDRVFSHPGLPVFDLVMPDGFRLRLGDSSCREDREICFEMIIVDNQGLKALFSLDEYSIALAYITSHLHIRGDFMSLLDLREKFTDNHPLFSFWRFIKPLFVGQVGADKEWVPKHYDHGDDFYFSFLDRTNCLYSQAVYKSEMDTLDQAATNKLEYIRDICRLKRGSKVLDVGAGWAAFARFSAKLGIDVTMLTLSHAQFNYLNNWIEQSSFDANMKVIMEDIFAFETDERYDAIVINGVMEHLPDYEGLFKRFKTLLKPHGCVYMDFIAGRKKYKVSTFTYRHVFEGNHTPVYMPGLMAAAYAGPFEPLAIHNDRHSYYLTLAAWARNLEAAHDKVAERFGEETYRLFQTYLWAGAHSLNRRGRLESYRVVFQKSMGLSSDGIGVYRQV